jgi:hypothetical protein
VSTASPLRAVAVSPVGVPGRVPVGTTVAVGEKPPRSLTRTGWTRNCQVSPAVSNWACQEVVSSGYGSRTQSSPAVTSRCQM